MKKIIITQILTRHQNYQEVRKCLDIRWADIFRKVWCLPIIVPTACTVRDYFYEVKIDGILLSGGNDLSLFSNDDLVIKRDNFEKELIEVGLENKAHIFGICRGMQIIRAYFGADFKKSITI